MTSNLKNVPPNWQKVRFDEIAQIVTDRIEKPVESGLSDYIGLEHLDTDCIRIKRFGSTEDVDATKFLCKKGDIIFGKRRAYLRKLAVSDREAVVSAHSMVLRPTGDKIYPDFLPCFMQSSIFWKTAHSISEGSMSPTIKWKTLAAQEFWLPSIEEQKKISELLWSIEDNIQKTEKLIETTETLKQGLLNELLTKGIGHTRFKDSELGRIPEEWEVVRLGRVSEVIMGQSPPSSSYNENGEGLPFFQGKVDFGNWYPKVTKYTNEPKKVAEEGDILFTVRAPVGEMNFCNQKCCIGRGISAIRNKDRIDRFYLYYLLTYFRLKLENLSQGSIFDAINSKELKNFLLALPTIEEQRDIVSVLWKCDKKINYLVSHVGRLSALKKKLATTLLSEI
ncbi:restriction endonuclease subunit S [Methanosarcina mazei]|uniref:Type I restriction modification DNA specificity domain-containing protein n=1 Tax=Methanosarcina mazei TaxID=2209 RepID=A0A0F8LBU0_METMZ|nr:restriction endonuclease subunit S [Methanosarcina mazei]KKH15555.1 hypothetical protein DU44_10570 [Methanosarcina mazei]KKH23345.1 hypothetical protein DU48_02255 [Methanosarcina mazei]KKH23432.1 hypothetical protein DU65_17380 [Methanosarcina mazei]